MYCKLQIQVSVFPKKTGEDFERFYQVESGREGSGIGLSLVQRLVELHHGRIELESEPGKVLLSPFTFRKINLYIAVKNCLEEKRTQTINGYTLRMRTTYISVMKKKPIQKAKKMRIQINEEHSLWWKTIKN